MLFAHRSFARLVRCTADSDSLLEIADALESGRVSTLIEVIDNEKTVTTFGRQNSVNVSGDAGNRVLSLTFAIGDVNVIASSLRQLAGKPDRSTITLAELGLLTPETSENDLEFYKLDKVPKLAHDYVPNVPGTTWDAVLYHADPTFEQFSRVREIVLDWAVPDVEGYFQNLFAGTPERTEIVDLASAHRRLVDPNDPTFQVNIYVEHPLIVRYGSPYTGAKIWLYRDNSEIIIDENCIASGDFQVDIRNFFAYRNVLLSMSEVLDATRVAWGDWADGWPMEQTADPSFFNNEDAMWATFVTGLEPCLGTARIPAKVEEAFRKKFSQETGHQS